MSEDFARVTAQPNVVTLDGRDYRVGKATPRDLGEVQAWFKEAVPNPKAEARRYMEGLPEAVQLEIWREACAEAKHWPPAFDAPEAQALLVSPEGMARLLWVALRRHTAGLTLDDARRLADRIGVEDLNRVMELFAPGEVGDPKARGAATA